MQIGTLPTTTSRRRHLKLSRRPGPLQRLNLLRVLGLARSLTVRLVLALDPDHPCLLPLMVLLRTAVLDDALWTLPRLNLVLVPSPSMKHLPTSLVVLPCNMRRLYLLPMFEHHPRMPGRILCLVTCIAR